MKRSYIFILMFILMITSSFAVTQNEILRWEFETGSGSIVFDTSGYNNNGILQSGAKYDNSPVKWGSYSIKLDGNNDFVAGLTAQDTPNILTVSVWVYSQDGNDWYLFEIDDTTETIEIEYDNTNNNLELGYFNDALIYSHFTLENINIQTNRWYHFVFTIDNGADTVTYWRDNNLILDNVSVTGGINKESTIKSLRLGTNHDANAFFDGNIDSLRMFDSHLNASQVSTLYNSNTITLQVDEDTQPEINNTIQTSIINEIYPVNNSSSNLPITLSATLSHKADCYIYIDNKLEMSYENILGYSFDFTKNDFGNHTTFTYCEYLNTENNTLSYEISPTINFEVLTFGDATLNFYLSGVDFNINDYELYIITPCLKDDLYLSYNPEIYKKFSNRNPIKFTKIVNGVASVEIPVGNNEFCILNGRVTYDTTNYTTNYNINSIDGQVKLGIFELPNNVTTNYNIKLEVFDIYGKTNPKAWGQTWTSLIGGIILSIMGALIIVTGSYIKNGKIVIAGVITFLAAFGISAASFVGLLI